MSMKVRILKLSTEQQLAVNKIWQPERNPEKDFILRYLSYANDYSSISMGLRSYSAADREFDSTPPLHHPTRDQLERMAPISMSFDRKNHGARILLDAIKTSIENADGKAKD